VHDKNEDTQVKPTMKQQQQDEEKGKMQQ